MKKTVDGAQEAITATSVANPQDKSVDSSAAVVIDPKLQVRYEGAAQRILSRATRSSDVKHFLFKDKHFRSRELTQVSVTWRKGRAGKVLSFVVDGAYPISVKL